MGVARSFILMNFMVGIQPLQRTRIGYRFNHDLLIILLVITFIFIPPTKLLFGIIIELGLICI